MEPTQNKLAVDATATIIIKPVDQYGKFIVEAGFKATSSDTTVIDNVATISKEYKVAGKQVGYSFEITAIKEGTATLTVAKGDIKATTNVIVEKAEAGLVDKVELVSKNMNADGTYKYPLQYVGETGNGTAIFGVKAYDANGNPVSIKDADIMVASSNEAIAAAAVSGGKVTVTAAGVVKAGVDSPVTITVRVLGVSTTIDLVVSDEEAKLNLDTLVALDADGEEADLSNIEVTAADTIGVDIVFVGIDQYGNEIDDITTYIEVENLNPSVATGSYASSKLTIKAASEATEGTATINVLDKNFNVLFTIKVTVVPAEA